MSRKGNILCKFRRFTRHGDAQLTGQSRTYSGDDEGEAIREGFDPRNLESIPPADHEYEDDNGEHASDDSRHRGKNDESSKRSEQQGAEYGSLGDSNVWDGSSSR